MLLQTGFSGRVLCADEERLAGRVFQGLAVGDVQHLDCIESGERFFTDRRLWLGKNGGRGREP